MTLEEVILEVLHPTIWKRSIQIWEEVEEFENDSHKKFNSVSLGSLWSTLDSLVSTDLAAKREAELTEDDVKSGRKTAFEFLLTHEGQRKRIERKSGSRGGAFDGLPSTT